MISLQKNLLITERSEERSRDTTQRGLARTYFGPRLLKRDAYTLCASFYGRRNSVVYYY